MSRVWFITGSSRGLGRSLASAVLASGDRVAATAREPEQLKDLTELYPDRIYPLKLDVTSKAQIVAAVENTIHKFGRIDVLVNNAGFGILGAAEAYSDAQVRSQLETNLYAPIAITRVVLPYMRRQRSGRILQISSIGGRVGNPGLTIYQAAKFGLGGFSEALAKEVQPLGIWVTSIEPGGFRTGAFASMTVVPGVEGYEKTVGARTELFKSSSFIPMGDPDKAAKVLIGLVDNPEPPVHLVLGSDAIERIKQADVARSGEMEKWLPVSTSTDAGDPIAHHSIRRLVSPIKKPSPIAYSCYTARSREGEQFIPEYVFSYQLSGTMVMNDGNKEYIFKPGDFRFGRRNHLIKFTKLPPEGGEYRSFSVRFDQPFLRNFSMEGGYKSDKQFEGDAVIDLKPDPLYKNYFDSLSSYRQLNEEEDATLVALKLREAVLLLLKVNPEMKDILFDFSEPGKIDLEAFMNRNFHFNVDLSRFAYLTGRSLATFKRDFEKLFHLTPSRWLQQRRLQEAYYLIKEKGKTASDIYLDLGFEDLSHFSFAFKKQFGVAPTKI